MVGHYLFEKTGSKMIPTGCYAIWQVKIKHVPLLSKESFEIA